VAAAADAGVFEVLAITIGENLPEQSSAGENVETDRRFGMVGVLRPAFDDTRCDPIDKAPRSAPRTA